MITSVSPLELQRLAYAHVERYSRMVEEGGPNVNVEDAAHYLRIWRGIVAKGCVYESLAPFEKQEVLEALSDVDDA